MLSPGKFPNELLQEVLAEHRPADPSVLIPPGVGEDCAVVAPEEHALIVMTSDPITFATDEISDYAVRVNLNDIVTTGATPRWFLTTLLFPPATVAEQVQQVMHRLHDLARTYGITVCGGHTEITDAVTRPVVIGQMVGVVAAQRLIDKRQIRDGDHLLLTKGAAIEGTAILAREIPQKLESLGLDEDLLSRARNFLHDPGICVFEEARIAAACKGVHGMHDVTEGGLATALLELSSAAGRGIEVHRDAVRVHPQTRAICDALRIDPLGLIGSGGLLIACAPAQASTLAEKIRAAGILVDRIGEALATAPGIRAVDRGGRTVPWPEFAVDEITRVAFD